MDKTMERAPAGADFLQLLAAAVADELEFTLKGFLTANHGVRNPVLRLKDAKGELIQSWTAPLPESGEFERKFIVSIPGWSKRIGSPVNTPVSFSSIYLACDKTAGDGKIFLESLEYRVKGELPKVCFVSDTPMNLLHSIGNGGIKTFRGRYIENGMIDFLMKEREAGRIRNLGFSFHGTKEVFDEVLAMHDQVHWDFVQIQLNYADWRYASGRNVNAEYLYAELEKRHIPAIIMEPLLGGRLSKLPEHLVARIKQRNPEASVASWAFRFAGTFPDVLTVLSGMTYMEHLQDNLRTYSPLVPLTDEDFEFLQQTADLMNQYPTIPCNDCKYCMPCPYGIDIPAVLIHYNKCVNEGNLPTSQEHANYQEARRAFLVGYDRSVPRLRQASHCIGCQQCVSHCPQSIDIPKELHRIDHYVEQLKQGTL